MTKEAEKTEHDPNCKKCGSDKTMLTEDVNSPPRCGECGEPKKK
jgi:hypothetical protein